MAELHFFTGTMDSGKSTLALQTNHNHAARGRVGRIFTTHDRAGHRTGGPAGCRTEALLLGIVRIGRAAEHGERRTSNKKLFHSIVPFEGFDAPST